MKKFRECDEMYCKYGRFEASGAERRIFLARGIQRA
jgi:hypothetical protein